MTAEEYLKEKTSFDVLTFEETVKLMSGFANLKKSEWCKEQREKCAKGLKKTIYGRTINAFLNPDEVEIIKNNILNAKEPEL